MGFPTDIAEKALLASGRFCCLCHKWCGTKMQTHHIVQNGDDSFDNCIPLCLECHAEVGSYNPSHPIGRKFTPGELKGHRDQWYQIVKEGKHFSAGNSLPDERELGRKQSLKHMRLLYYADGDSIPFCPRCLEATDRQIHLFGPVPMMDQNVERWECHVCNYD